MHVLKHVHTFNMDCKLSFLPQLHPVSAVIVRPWCHPLLTCTFSICVCVHLQCGSQTIILTSVLSFQHAHLVYMCVKMHTSNHRLLFSPLCCPISMHIYLAYVHNVLKYIHTFNVDHKLSFSPQFHSLCPLSLHDFGVTPLVCMFSIHVC